MLVPGAGGTFFEDEFSFDMFFIPFNVEFKASLFEMKTVTSDNDAHARVKSAVGQLSYYEYFHAGARLDENREIQRVIVVDGELAIELIEYLSHEGIAALSYPKDGVAVALNQLGDLVLSELLTAPAIDE